MPAKKSSKMTKKSTKPELEESDKIEEINPQEKKEETKVIIEKTPLSEKIPEPDVDTQIEEPVEEKIEEINKIEEIHEDEPEEIQEIEEINEDDANTEIHDGQLGETSDQIPPTEDNIEVMPESESEKQDIPSQKEPSTDLTNEAGINAELTPKIENPEENKVANEEQDIVEVSDEEITVVEEETIPTKKGGKKTGDKEDTGEKTVSVKELTEKSQIKNRIEAAMFIAGRPVSAEELSIKLDIGKKQIEDLIKELALDYMDRITSIEIVQVGEKFSMQIKPEYTEHVKKFTTGGLIPEAVMRTLTIIALKQPISKSLVVKMRGAGAYDHIKFLIDRGFIEQSKKGRSMDLETTDQFSDTFGLSRDKKKLKEVLIQQLGITAPVKSGDEEAEDQKARKEALNKKKEDGQPPAE